MKGKTITCFLLIAIFLLGTCNVSAATRNGRASGSITVNGVNYSCAVYISGADQQAAKTICTTKAKVSRNHGQIVYRYRSVKDGIVTVTGASKNYASISGTTYSGVAKPSSKYSAFVKCVYAEGNVTVTARNQNGTTNKYSYTPQYM